MGNVIHSKQQVADGIHTPIAFEYANAAARTGATGFVSTDLYKFARQTDDGSIWILTAITPTWVQVGVFTTSAQLAAALSDETGTGVAVFSTSPAFTTQISTPKIVTASGNLEILPAGNADVVLQGSGTGNVAIGGASSAYGKVAIRFDGSASVVNALAIHNGGATANGTGSKIRFTALRAAGDIQDFTYINSVVTDNTTSLEDARLTLGTMVQGTLTDTLNVVGGNVGIGITVPTATLHLKAGSTVQYTAPLKFTSGSLLTTTEVGVIEFLSDAYYATITTGAGTAAARKTIAFLESPVFTTQITTPKIVTVSGNLEITPAGNANVIVGNGVAGNNQVIQFIGGTDAGKGAGIQFLRGVTAFFSIFNEAFVLGSGASSTPCFLANTGLGMKFMVDGSTVASVEISSGGNVGIGTATPTARLHLPAGTTVANTAPLKFTSGTLLTTPEAGAVEYDGAFFHVSNSSTRYRLGLNYYNAVSALNVTPTTIFTPTKRGAYVMAAFIIDAGANYHATAIIVFDATTVSIQNYSHGANMTITLSGNAVQVTQSSGTTQSVDFYYSMIAV